MESLIQIKRKIDSVAKTAQITNAMKLVSTSKYNKMVEEAKHYDQYAGQVRQMMTQMVQAPMYELPENLWIVEGQSEQFDYRDLLERSKDRKIGYLIISSDKGLAGNYNSNLLKSVEAFFDKHHASKEDIKVFAIGQPVVKFCHSQQIEVVHQQHYLPDYPTYTQVQRIIERAITLYTEGVYDALYICYQHSVNVLQSEIRIEPFLPLNHLLQKDQPKVSSVDYVTEPGNQVVINELLRQYAESQIYGAIIDAKTAEQASRMQAMSQATDNAEDIISSLKLQYNKARQVSVTNEMLDIINGSSVQ
ncbi:ATP synthase F1 subunit gamma [Hutsoniella sourekii]|uniref:ATP synthase F1 subunit gamma n=1 Tax=Hutsoniella sourekii TaxID=87650 RepID=UPI0004B64DE3|nr:ATP synthase F1 subunit gamma [Hutsoniella sourekii]